jgi:pimeloyl-ACP methyl ester carboxylesterase
VRILTTLFIIVAVAYIAACATLFFLQRSFLYYPQPSRAGSSATTMRLTVEGADILVSVRPHGGPGALIYFGGNAEDVSASLPSFSSAFPDRALYFLHYRGYGGSSGKPSEEAIQKDALALFDKVQAEHPDIVVVGRSLGSGVAIRLASQRPASHLVLVTPYDSMEGLAARQFPYFPVRWLLIDKYESGRYAPRIKIPTLLLAAEHDEVIPRQSTERLYERFARGVAVLQVIPGAGHNTISASPAYMETLRGAIGRSQ